MRKLLTVTAILVLLAPAIGCESCLFRGARAQPAPTCVPPCEPGCAPGCRLWAGRWLLLVCSDDWRDGTDARPGELIVAEKTRNTRFG